MTARSHAAQLYVPHFLTLAMTCITFLSPILVAAELPEHEPVSMLIFADEVNPHRLADTDLTQPQDLAPALTATDSPLHIAEISTVNSQCADAALDTLASANPPDVVLYFAHRAAKRCDGSDAQTKFTQLLKDGLGRGLGVVVLHHGLYIDFVTPGAKDSLLQLLGARSNSIAWDTTNGQRVFNVAGAHFVTSNGMAYTQQAAFNGAAGVAAGVYPYFVNLPDELYADTIMLEEEGEVRSLLFASDSGGERILGYTLTRTGWKGRVVAYQPAEYQPNALDDHDGPNYQILVNAVYYAAYGDGEGTE
jgi:ABC-type cobalt transport system substrate-binding protein